MQEKHGWSFNRTDLGEVVNEEEGGACEDALDATRRGHDFLEEGDRSLDTSWNGGEDEHEDVRSENACRARLHCCHCRKYHSRQSWKTSKLASTITTRRRRRWSSFY